MAGPYRNNVVRASGYSNSTFSPPLDAIFVTNAPSGAVTMTVSDTSVIIPAANLGTGTLFEVGDISSVNAASGFAFIGLRALNKSGSSNVTDDTP
tara:strand:+ start:1142 stop:1426 length:285 start_codon:yes stop_codon:yes gene_type:complete